MYIDIHCRVIYFEHNKHCKISNDECIGILLLLHRISKKHQTKWGSVNQNDIPC